MKHTVYKTSKCSSAELDEGKEGQQWTLWLGNSREAVADINLIGRRTIGPDRVSRV